LINNEDKKRFERGFEKTDSDKCWIWKKSIGSHGYGQVNYNKKPWLSHRLSYLLYKGEIPGDMCVCHACDVRSCVNPNHLWLGNDKDNAVDKVKKGKAAQTPETALKISKAKKGIKQCEESRKNMSIAQKNAWKNNKYTGRKSGWENNKFIGMSGKHHTEELKLKISEMKKKENLNRERTSDGRYTKK